MLVTLCDLCHFTCTSSHMTVTNKYDFMLSVLTSKFTFKVYFWCKNVSTYHAFICPCIYIPPLSSLCDDSCSILFHVYLLFVTVSHHFGFGIKTFLHLHFIAANLCTTSVIKADITSIAWGQTTMLQYPCSSFISKLISRRLSLSISSFISPVLWCAPFGLYFKLEHSVFTPIWLSHSLIILVVATILCSVMSLGTKDSVEMKLSGHEADFSPLCNAEARDVCSHTSTFPLFLYDLYR